MFEKAAPEHQQINLAETVNDNQTTEIRRAVIVSMKAQEFRGSQEGFRQVGKETWQRNIGDRSKLVARMLTVGAEESDYSIWQAVWENLPEVDPERTLLSLDAPSRQWLLQLFQDTADEAWGKEKARKIESEGFTKIGDKWEFDPEELQTDLFSVAEAAIGKMRELKLLPGPLPREVKKLQEITTYQARTIELLNRLFMGVAETIEEWPDDMKLEVAREKLVRLPRGINEIFTKALAIAGAKFRAEDIPRLKAELIEEIIKPLPLLEQMVILMNGSGRFDRQIKVTTEGQPCELFNLMFPEVSGMGSIAKISRSNEGSLRLELSAMFPDKKGSSMGRYNLFQLPVTVDGNGTLQSVQDVNKIWKDLPRQVKNWLEDNLLKEAEFTARLRDPQKTLFRELSNYLGKRKAFLKDGSLKFVWDNKSNLLTVSAEGN